MNNGIDVTLNIILVTCVQCGCVFGLESRFQKAIRNDHRNFYCPNGHVLGYTVETEAEKLRAQLQQTERSLKWARERSAGEQRRAEHAERRLCATKGVVTKMRKRDAPERRDHPRGARSHD